MEEYATLPIGTVVARRYQIRKVLGRGGMGTVYQAVDTHTSKRVALKTLRSDRYDREDLVTRFEREARASARIGHPSVVGVHALGCDHALRARFIVEEELQGTDVAGCLEELGSLSAPSVVAIALPVMDALSAAHAAGIVHRDIKPENVFLHEADDGRIVPKVIDFGIAKVTGPLGRRERTETGMVFGTPWYMSPEQALGDSAIDARTDIWSLGATLYEMLCGTAPFSGSNPNVVMAQIIHGRPTPLRHHWPEVPADLEEVIHKALEHDLEKRYATMAEFRDALAACHLWRGVTPEIAQSLLPRPGLAPEAPLPVMITTQPEPEPDVERPRGRALVRSRRLGPAVNFLLTLVSGAALAVGVMHWMQRPQPAGLTASLVVRGDLLSLRGPSRCGP